MFILDRLAVQEKELWMITINHQGKRKEILFSFSNFSEVNTFGMEYVRYQREMLTHVNVGKFILAYLYLVNGLSNLGNIYSCFKNREITKLIISQRHTLKVTQN